MKNLIVIGSNSFSGSNFVSNALSKGYSVVGISRSSEPNNVFLPYKWQENSNFEFKKLDVNRDLNEICKLLAEMAPEYVVNFAAQSMVAQSWEKPKDWYMTNTVSMIELHNHLRKLTSLKRYVHVSTPEVYGSCSGFVKEDFPFNPSTPYAVSRAAADMSLKSFYSAYNFPVVTTRAANVYGPGQQLYRIISRTILFILLGKKIQLHGGGISTRSFIHMNDVSEATLKIMLNGQNGHTYHISTNEVISIKNLVEMICNKLNVSFLDCVEIAQERLGKDSAYHLDSSKLRHELGWEDKISLSQGIDDCINWVKEHLDTLKQENWDYIHKE